MYHTSVLIFRLMWKPSHWPRMIFEHLVYKAVFGCLVWSSTLAFNIGKPRLKSLQLHGITDGEKEPMGMMTELMYMTVAQIIAEKAIGSRSPWECLHTAFWNFYALLTMIVTFALRSYHVVSLKWVKYVRDPWYRFQGVDVPTPPPKVWYQYKKLEDRHIRLLLIHRSWWFKVSYYLLDIPLDDVLRYEAISYTWAMTPGFEEITIDSKPFRTPRAVGDIMRRRSKLIGLWPGNVRALWIDYLCINQEDINEKNQQVPLMREIYEKSHRVMICLGDAFNASKANWLLIKLHTMSNIHTPEELAKKYFLEKDSPSWIALANMISHPWFNRIWVVQEVATAPKVWVTYGGGLIDWELMCWGLHLFTRPEMSTLLPAKSATMRRNLPLALEHGHVIADIRELRQNKRPLTLADAMTRCTRFGATDPRDKVFALLGLVVDDIDIKSWVDYNKPVEDVYRQATRYLLSQGSNPLDVLDVAGVGYPRALAKTPSWSPDWSCPPKASAFNIIPDAMPYLRYNASGGRKHDSSILLNAGLSIIRLKGIKVDEIKTIAKPRNFWLQDATDEEMTNAPTEIGAWFKEIHSLAEQTSPDPYHTGQSIEEALWRTCHGDRTLEGRPMPPSMSENYQAFRTLLFNPPPPTTSYDTMVDLGMKSSRFLGIAAGTIKGRRFSLSKKGYIGWVPPLTQEGDLVCLFAGAHTPFLVRPHDRGGGLKMAYLLVGACYFNGMMDGELWGEHQESEIFTLC